MCYICFFNHPFDDMILQETNLKCSRFCQQYTFTENSEKNMLAGDHNEFYGIQHPEIYLLDMKVQYKHKIELPLDMVGKHVLLYHCLHE